MKKNNNEALSDDWKEKINQALFDDLKENKMNFAQCLFPNNDKKFSVVAKFCDHLEYNTISGQSYTSKDSYYGISPKVDATFLIDCITNLKLLTEEDLDKLIINDNPSYFCLRTSNKDYIKAFAACAIVSLISLYGVEIKFQNKELLGEVKQKFSSENDIIIYPEISSPTMIIKGCPTKKIIEYFKDNLYYQIDSEVFSNDKKGISIIDFYKNYASPKLIDNSVFYSGVLLRTVKLEDKKTANADISVLCMNFERTTFATVLTFTYPVLKHPILCDNYKNTMIELLKEDDTIADMLYDECKRDKGNLINTINNYLSNTYSVSQIVVTGNLITKDNVLLLGVRNAKSIDSGSIYPGINGNAEVYDENVQFYLDSVYEDFPDIRLDTKRIDFYGELNREAYAEIGTILNRQKWECKTVAIIGNVVNKMNNKDKYGTNHIERRIHFNIICEQKCDYRYLDICEKQQSSTEKYENEKMMGVISKDYSNFGCFFIDLGKSIFKFILSIKDIVTSILSIVLFIMLVNSSGFNGMFDKIISISFTVLVCFSSTFAAINRFINHIKKKNSTKTVHVITNLKPFKKISNFMHKLFISKNKPFDNVHPATFIAVKTYLIDKIKK